MWIHLLSLELVDGASDAIADVTYFSYISASEWIAWYVKGVEMLRMQDTSLDVLQNLTISTIKSGATQVGAGAAAGEVWKTASHATLPDDVLMIGV